MKKFIALLLAVVMVLGLCACSVSGGKKTEITLWTYPVGQWGDQATVEALVASFNEKYPDIGVTVEYLTYADGDDKVNTAIEGKATPDIVVEGPERLVTNWGAKGAIAKSSSPQPIVAILKFSRGMSRPFSSSVGFIENSSWAKVRYFSAAP